MNKHRRIIWDVDQIVYANSLCLLKAHHPRALPTVLYAPKVSCTNGEPLTSLACIIRIHKISKQGTRHAQNVEEIREKIKSIHNPSYSGLRETTCLLKFRQLGKEVIRDWPVASLVLLGRTLWPICRPHRRATCAGDLSNFSATIFKMGFLRTSLLRDVVPGEPSGEYPWNQKNSSWLSSAGTT